MDDASIRVICGPTAAGKSGIALALAERHGATIISADSRQIYTGFDIGTAKPSAEERARVPHRGIDIADPTERFSAARWAEGAQEWISEAEAYGRIPLVVGGTGFYLRALAAPFFDEPPLATSARDRLAAQLAPLPLMELRRWCTELDPGRAHLGRAQLLRGIEIALLTGVPLSEWHRRTARAPRHRLRYLLVDPGAGLARRIADRTTAMAAAGWEDEVRALIGTVPADAPAWKSTGYRVIRDLVEGRISRSDAYGRVVIDTRQYAKRQRTWFRNQLRGEHVTLVEPGAPGSAELVETWWNEGSAR